MSFFEFKDDIISLRNCIDLLGCINGRFWHQSNLIFTQISGLGQIYTKKLYYNKISTFNELMRCKNSKIEVILKRNPPFGRNLKNTIYESFPLFEMDANHDYDKQIISISYSLENIKITKFSGTFYLIVIGFENDLIGHKFLLKRIK